MKQIKILFTSVGRRVELMQAFKDAAAQKRIKLEIYGADCDMTAPALSFCDKKIQLCRICETNYISQLLRVCEQKDCSHRFRWIKWKTTHKDIHALSSRRMAVPV